MKTGLLKIRKDHRDASYPQTFGSTETFPAELNLDHFQDFPDQVALGLPQGCTGFTQSEICQDEDGTRYKPEYTYQKTLMMMGAPDGSSCDIRASLKSTLVYGVQATTETTDEQAEQHRRGRYYNVVDESGLDAFDDIRSALTKENKSICFALPWFDEFNTVGPSGILPVPWTTSTHGHNVKICGLTEIHGKPYLILKTWQGQGYKYMPRETLNFIMPKSLAFILAPYAEGDYYTVKLSLLETLLSYYQMLLAKVV